MIDLGRLAKPRDDTGWYAIKLTTAGELLDRPAIKERLGADLTPDTPVVVARRRADAPFKDVEVAVPVTDETARRYRAGHPETQLDVVREVVEEYARFMAQARH